MSARNSDRSINIAVIAMGGQGGGVLSKWILDLAQSQGYIAQYTSVPGVAQRTGATIYYIELFPMSLAQKAGREPILALMPVEGNVDIVIASELMEAGRAVVRGFVSKETTLIASDHRDYAIVEKQVMGDGRKPGQPVKEAAGNAAGRFICFDMDSAARNAGSVISSVLFGALAGSKALPFERETFEETIKLTNKAVAANLKGFAAGYETAQQVSPPGEALASSHRKDLPTAGKRVAPLLKEVHETFPPETHFLVTEALKKTLDYHGLDYAREYIEHMRTIIDVDRSCGGERKQWRLSQEMARYLALAMCYQDTFRVADQKTRRNRFTRFREDVKADENQIVNVSEFMHPRYQEICEMMPAPLGRACLNNGMLTRLLSPFFKSGKRVSTTKLRGFLVLYTVARLRWLRKISYKHHEEMSWIQEWMQRVFASAKVDYELACEVAGLQRLIKGYGDTHARGLKNYQRIITAFDNLKSSQQTPAVLAKWKKAALQDEEGVALDKALAG
ncbi:MAG: indolepyruvate oxidoreductase subunit beta family protein [Hyphomonadaceae bacterium]|nr:indolepyruvate oxidoreductase subunit beta family protein [Hyphomonadaceae bacterium]